MVGSHERGRECGEAVSEEEIVKLRRALGNDILNLIDHLSEKRGLASRWSESNAKQVAADITLINKATGLNGNLRKLVTLLREEIRASAGGDH